MRLKDFVLTCNKPHIAILWLEADGDTQCQMCYKNRIPPEFQDKEVMDVTEENDCVEVWIL